MKYNYPVVIVDDDSEDIDLLTEIISHIDAKQQVISFTGAEQALDYLRETEDKPLIILSDVNMPRMNGIHFRKTIYNEKELRKKSIPFIFYTTAIDKDAVEEAYNLTVQGYFKKEGSMQDIENMLREMFTYWKRCVHPNDFG